MTGRSGLRANLLPEPVLASGKDVLVEAVAPKVIDDEVTTSHQGPTLDACALVTVALLAIDELPF